MKNEPQNQPVEPAESERPVTTEPVTFFPEQTTKPESAIENEVVTPPSTTTLPEIEEPAPLTPIFREKKQSKLGLVVTLLVILLTLAGAATWYVLNKDSDVSTKDTSAATIETPVAVPDIQDADGVVEYISQELGNTYTLIETTDNLSLEKNQIAFTKINLSPTYKVEGYDFYTSTAQGGASVYISSWSPQNGDTPVKDINSHIVSIYERLGFTKGDSITQKDGQVTLYFTKDNLVYSSGDPDTSLSVPVHCGDITSLSEAAAKIKPFADANPDTTASTVYSDPSVTESQTTGYELGHLGIGDTLVDSGASAQYYRKDGGNWIYFTTRQSASDCSAYSTDDLKKAYKGEFCYDMTTRTDNTVQ